MFGIGANELIIILIFGFIIFGPDKLPAMAKTIGQAIAKFRSAQAEMSKVIKTEVYDPDAEDPFKNPLDALSKLESQAKKEDRGESFTARKARYDKQRAAKKAAEERKQENAAKKAAEAEAKAAALEAGEDEATAKEAAKVAGTAAVAKVKEDREAQSAAEPSKQKISAADLYGIQPKAKKAAPKKTASSVAENKAKKVSTAPVEKTATEATDGAAGEEADAPTEEKGE